MDISSGTLIVGVICAVVGVVLGQFLSRVFARGDKADDASRNLELRVAKLEDRHAVDHELQWYRVREQVREEYATKDQIDALSSKVDDALGRIERMLLPVFKRMYPDAAVPE